MPKGEKKPGNKGSTRWVFLNLYKDHPDKGFGWSVWESFSLTSQEQFTKEAKKWLGDRSELRAVTIDTADWKLIYENFKAWDDEEKKSKGE